MNSNDGLGNKLVTTDPQHHGSSSQVAEARPVQGIAQSGITPGTFKDQDAAVVWRTSLETCKLYAL